tara:strand:- start:427 stop:756 length:330 start_codon:yes stop_codon:yes gene_type:complete
VSAAFYAWMLMILAALSGVFGLHRLFADVRYRSMKAAILGGVLAFLLVPSEIPRIAGEYAPAFVVFIFELIFQTNGAPGLAGGILLVAVVLGAGGAFLVSRRFNGSSAG